MAGAVALMGACAELPGATLTLPDDAGAPSGAPATVPLAIDDAAGILGADLTISFDAAAAGAVSVSKTTLSASHALTVNLGVPGEIRISLFGSQPLSGSGTLLVLDFVSGEVGLGTPLHFRKAQLNEGTIPATAVDGWYCVPGAASPVHDLAVGTGLSASQAILSWPQATGVMGYHIYRGTQRDLSDLACLASGVGGTSWSDDASAPAPGTMQVFLVTSFTCSEESSAGAASSGAERALPAACR